MRGDVMRCIRWCEVNNCDAFKEWEKWKVKVYGEVVEGVEFDNKLDAKWWLLDYYCKKKKGWIKEMEEKNLHHNKNEKGKFCLFSIYRLWLDKYN